MPSLVGSEMCIETVMLLVSYIDYNFILRFSWLIYLGAVGLLGLVIVAGEQSKGAQRWFKIGGFQFQPSELVKILMILFLAYYFMRHEEKINSPQVLFGSCLLYTSDAADDLLCVDLGVSRIIKKQNSQTNKY